MPKNYLRCTRGAKRRNGHRRVGVGEDHVGAHPGSHAVTTPQLAGQSPCITDCKALYDAARSSSCGRGIAEKRTAIEVMMMNERMQVISVVWKWTNTTQQLADGLTKLVVRQTFAEMMRRRWHALKFDPTFTTGKTLSQKQRQEIDAGWPTRRPTTTTTRARITCTSRT